MIYDYEDLASLSIAGDDTALLLRVESQTASLYLFAIEKLEESLPTGDGYGLPIGPLSFNTLGSTQVENPNQLFPDSSTLELSIGSDASNTIAYSYEDTTASNIAAEFTTTTKYTFEDQGNLGILTFDTKETYLNSEETGFLEIAATDVIQQLFVFDDTAAILINDTSTHSFTSQQTFEATISTSIQETVTIAYDYTDSSSSSLEASTSFLQKFNFTTTAPANIDLEDNINQVFKISTVSSSEINARTFAKEYTFLQQEYLDDTINLNLLADSDETYVELGGGGGGTVRRKQYWIG